ncbi:MAG TPA: serine/threonine-protein kinase [Solirubrobacteraceae bacterium]
MPEAPADPRVGSTVAGYRIGARIGRGGMGVVYRAEHLQLGRPAALKIVAPELAGDREFRRRFEHEARIAAQLAHPHVVPVYDAGDADGLLYLAMALIEGGDLAAELAARGALDPARALLICGQVAGALDAAHAIGLIHRDVKPANVLLDERGSYLTDFGLVRRRGATTRPGDIVGTIDYVAPEQIEGRDLDGRADQYALAAVLHHCLCGTPPFRRDTEVAVMYAHLREPPPPASAVRPGLPEALDGVLARGLDKAARRRFESCAALVAAAREALEAAGEIAPAARPVPPEGDDPSVETLTELPRVDATADRRTRVLLAGVDPQTRALARVALAGRCDVREVDSGDEVAAVARELRPDLVLLDWDAPGAGPAPTVAALRADPGTRETKVVLVVDWQAAGSPDVAAAGADEMLEAPFSPLQLQVKLRRLLGGV